MDSNPNLPSETETLPPPHDPSPPPPQKSNLSSQPSNPETQSSSQTLPPSSDAPTINGSAAATGHVNPSENGHNLLLPIPKPLLSETYNTRSGTDKDQSGGEEEATSMPRRRSRWDPPRSLTTAVENQQVPEPEAEKQRRRGNRVGLTTNPVIQLPEFMGGIEFDPEIQALNCRLLEISRMLQSGLPLDDRPEGARSPSPEPIYDNMGIRINTREYRARETLQKERQEIISQIIKKNPAFKPPADYWPPKLQKKLYIPMKEYPMILG